MFRIISLIALCAFTIAIFILFFIDEQKKRAPHNNPFITFIIPCYNDGHIIKQTIHSIYNSYNKERFELIVVNDCSKDNSAEVIKSMQSEYDFKFIDLPKNGGKSDALNIASQQAQYDMICFVDADGIINPIALNDVLERFHGDSRMWAISCPYTPSNMDSFWAKMQDIEYTMLKFVQWCYNVTSALAARWGCLVVRKQAFNEVGMFSLHAITEDMDLALKMNKYHRHVQQSPCEIKSEVPYTFQMWLKQKIRRCSGGTQAFLSYVSVWIRNPLHMIFTLLLFSVSIFWTIALFTRLIFFGEIIDIFISLLDILTLKHGWNFIMALYGNQIITNSIQASAFTLLSLPYVLFAIKSKDQRWKVLLLFPYTLFYMSLYGIIGLYSTWLGIYKFATLKKWVRSW